MSVVCGPHCEPRCLFLADKSKHKSETYGVYWINTNSRDSDFSFVTSRYVLEGSVPGPLIVVCVGIHNFDSTVQFSGIVSTIARGST
jgi:hypothetical protein